MNLYLLSVFLQPFLVAPGGQTRECIEFVPLRTHLAFHHADYCISFLSSRLRVLLLPLNIPCLAPVAQMVSFPHHAGISRLLLPLERAHATVWRLTDSAAQLFRDVNLPLNASQSIHCLSCDAYKERERKTRWHNGWRRPADPPATSDTFENPQDAGQPINLEMCINPGERSRGVCDTGAACQR